MRAAQPLPGPTGVRVAGDRYQWLLAWLECVHLLHEHQTGADNPVEAIGVEVDGVGNLDDLVVYRRQPPHTYKQIKYGVDAQSPVNTDYLTAPSKTGGPSILAKIAKSWQDLTRGGDRVELALVTNRAPDATDLLIGQRDARTRLLVPRGAVGSHTSQLGRARQAWADAAGVDLADLLRMLEVLEFDTARDRGHVEQVTKLTMLVSGLRDDDQALAVGGDWVAEQVVAGVRALDLAAITAAVDALELCAAPARTVVSVATLLPDPMAPQARHRLDWVDRFEGETSFEKRKPKAPATWDQLQNDIEALATQCRDSSPIAVTGSLRLATAFAVGASLRMVTNTEVAVVQRGSLWSSDALYDAVIPPVVREVPISQGEDLAVAVAIAADPTVDVAEYLRKSNVPVSRLVVLSIAGDPRDNAVQSSEHACGIAIGLRNEVRTQARSHPRIHLFQAGPMGLALLLGHRWNRQAPTLVYEDLGPGRGYDLAFNIGA